jgi:hypothetical protein
MDRNPCATTASGSTDFDPREPIQSAGIVRPRIADSSHCRVSLGTQRQAFV